MDINKRKFFTKTHEEKLKIMKENITLEVGYMDHRQIAFWLDNPRILHIIETYKGIIDPADIEKELNDTEAIADLAKRIESDGQINEPLLVMEKDWVVVEGNRRLASVRSLYKKNITSDTWINVPIKLIPSDVPINLINMYLGDINLIGKKKWKSYNEAGFLAKIKIERNFDFPQLAEAYKMTLQDVTKKVKTYNFMREKGETDPDRYSYFELLYTNTVMRKYFEKNPEFGDIYVNKIQRGEMPQALQVRTSLPKILKTKDKSLLKDFLTNKVKFTDAIEAVREEGSDKAEFIKIDSFHMLITEPDTKKNLMKLTGNTLNTVIQKLRKISETTKDLKVALENKKAGYGK